MLGFCQKFHYHNRQYLLRIVDSDLQHTKIDEQVGEMYNRCFQGEIWGGIVSQLLEFSNGVGPTSIGFTLVVIECVSEKPVFLASWIWNGQTRAIEMFNTCKDLSDKHFSAFHILDQVNRYIVPLMAVKYGGTSPETVKYRLAVLQKNPYLISALHTYSRLGFRVEKEIVPVSLTLSPFFTMSRKITENGQVFPEKLADNLIRVAVISKYSSQDLQNLVLCVKNKKKRIDFSQNQESDLDYRKTWKLLRHYLIQKS